MQQRAIRYRAYPNEQQNILFQKTFGCCRKVWNLMLSDKEKWYAEHHKVLYVTPARYKQDYPFLKEVDSLALANVQMNLQTAFENCYQKKIAEAPKFRSKRRSRRSFTTNCQIPRSGQPTIRIGEGSVHLPKAGDIRVVIHRQPDPSWRLKSATVSQDSGGSFYISVLFEYDDVPMQHTAFESLKVIGLDYKSDGLFTASDGSCPHMPKYYRNSQKRLARAQKKLSRRKGARKEETPSKNYIKQCRTVGRIHTHTANQRKDYLHKLSAEIANRYDVVCAETLDMRSMSSKKSGRGKSTMDNGYGMFLRMLEYKLKARGKDLVRVDKWYPSSQLCHMCGHRQPMPLKIRTYNCPVCGMSMDRDYNAAINIHTEGIRIFQSA